jgi:hypothetical protein
MLKHISPRFLALLIVIALALASGCAKPPLRQGPVTPRSPSQPVVQKSTLQLADEAFEAGIYGKAERLYRQAAREAGLKRETAVKAWYGAAESAVEAGSPKSALEALQNLALITPEVGNDWEWHDLYVRALIDLDRRDGALQHLDGIVRDSLRPFTLRSQAGLELADISIATRNYEQAAEVLSSLYAEAEFADDKNARAELERSLAERLQIVDPVFKEELHEQVLPNRQYDYPYSIFRLSYAGLLAGDGMSGGQARRILDDLERNAELADPLLVQEAIEALGDVELSRTSANIALILPVSGNFASLSWKILRGVGAAQWELASQGMDVGVTVINSEAEDWKAQLLNLPMDTTIVGGPLRPTTFKSIADGGLSNRYVFFTFLPRVEGLGQTEIVEGRDAWRFFSSPADEVDALTKVALNDLGIDRMGVLYPDERFGRKWLEQFSLKAQDSMSTADTSAPEEGEDGEPLFIWDDSVVDMQTPTGFSITKAQAYPPGDPTKWTGIVADFLDVRKSAPGTPQLPPDPDFQAVFLPDGWNRAKSIVPNFFFHDEERMIIMGPSLWSQTLLKARDVETRYFGLTMFPGAWWPRNQSAAADSLRNALESEGLGEPDFWVALGYDFFRFAAEMAAEAGTASSQAVNAALADMDLFSWSMAPITWTDEGKARQELFLFKPAREGMVLFDTEKLKRRLASAEERRKKRLEQALERARQNRMDGDPAVESEVENRVQELLERIEQ